MEDTFYSQELIFNVAWDTPFMGVWNVCVNGQESGMAQQQTALQVFLILYCFFVCISL